MCVVKRQSYKAERHVWAARHNRVIRVHSRVLLTLQRFAKHAQPICTTEAFGVSRLIDSRGRDVTFHIFRTAGSNATYLAK